MRRFAGIVDAAARIVGPWLDLAIRLWLAQAFLAVQIHGLMLGHAVGASLDTSWWTGAVRAVTSSGLGLLVQAACPLLLAPGLLARPAAAAMLLQLAASQTAGMPMMAPLMMTPFAMTPLTMTVAGPGALLLWAMLLARIVAIGPGAISLDHLLRRGADSSALPGAARLAAAYRLTRVWLAPWVALVLRLCLAAGPATAALAAFGLWPAMRAALTPLVPQLPAMVAHLPPLALGLLALLLLAGGATRIAALILLFLVPFGALTGVEDARLYWALLCAVVAVQGAGAVSIDRAVRAWLDRTVPIDRTGLPHVVVVGGGFGGVAAVAGLRRAPCRITLIDRRNYHLFQPLLYQVATAGLSPADIATPVRALFRTQPNVRVVLGEVTGIDAARRSVQIGDQPLAYDMLVLATGARHSYFGHEEWADRAPGLKSLEDGTAIRARLLRAFEAAENAADPAERKACLTFVIVGGGPTGVELAGAIAELAHNGMTEEFREIDPAEATVILVQSGPRLLPTFPEGLSRAATRALRRLGVDVRTDAKVESVDAAGVTISGQPLAARTVLWAAGGDGLTGGAVARGRRGSCRPGAGGGGSLGGRPARHLRRWRHRSLPRVGGQGRPRPGPRREAGRRLRRARHPRAARRPHPAAPVPLPASGEPRHHRPPGRRRRFRLPAPAWRARVVALGRRPRVLPGRRPQPAVRPGRVAVGLPDLSPRQPVDHRRSAVAGCGSSPMMAIRPVSAKARGFAPAPHQRQSL